MNSRQSNWSPNLSLQGSSNVCRRPSSLLPAPRTLLPLDHRSSRNPLHTYTRDRFVVPRSRRMHLAGENPNRTLRRQGRHACLCLFPLA